MRLLLSLITICGTLCAADGQTVADKGRDPEAKKPAITQNEILEALDLDIAKIRIVNIPKGQNVRFELVESTKEPLATRRLIHFVAKPDSDWIELLISAHSPPEGCRRIKMTIHHESPIFWDWTLDIEKQFGIGKRAVPIEHSNSVLRIGDTIVTEYGEARVLAEFRLAKSKPGRTYSIMLNAFEELRK